MSLSEKQLIAIEKLVMGCNHQEAANAAGVARSTIYRWCDQGEFQEALKGAKERILKGHSQAIDSYKQALLEAVKHSSDCINVLLEIAKNPNTRTSDRLKAVEMLLQQPQKLMGLLAENAVFPEERLAQEQEERIRKQQLEAKLIASPDWRKTDDGYWTDDSLSVFGQLHTYDVEKAYEKLTNPTTFFEL
ncbi:MAG: hypothetical protein F6J86_26060 [Symploca sp. SIO1B1]|nr:hypothetical protein [Symploca sp. SIO1B1]